MGVKAVTAYGNHSMAKQESIVPSQGAFHITQMSQFRHQHRCRETHGRPPDLDERHTDCIIAALYDRCATAAFRACDGHFNDMVFVQHVRDANGGAQREVQILDRPFPAGR